MVNAQGNGTSNYILGYLVCSEDKKLGYMGAMMLTDLRGRPLHFSCVSPIRPSKMQRILYGATLADHLKVDVIAKKLFSDLPQKPNAILVNTPTMLAISRITDVPAACLSNGKPEISDEEGNHTITAIVNAADPSIDINDPFSRMDEAMIEIISSTKNTKEK
ncbi:MAG: hypothetical protein J7M01_03885 [Candidatus Marinimicrobia bacterium]|nr:hypothetical protein [Candidatus Neomarinimicrobiota bacterium]